MVGTSRSGWKTSTSVQRTILILLDYIFISCSWRLGPGALKSHSKLLFGARAHQGSCFFSAQSARRVSLVFKPLPVPQMRPPDGARAPVRVEGEKIQLLDRRMPGSGEASFNVYRESSVVSRLGDPCEGPGLEVAVHHSCIQPFLSMYEAQAIH